MKKMAYQNVKGTQDYLPEAEAIRRKVRRTLEDVFIQYGCRPLETPILNYTDLLASKYAGGAEIMEEMYTLADRGGRDLALRYDLTIPFAKVAAMNPGLRKPFKRYEIGKVFRDGPIKTGRLREFTQCDVDITGVNSQIAEAELMIMALEAFEKMALNVVIQYNNRKLLAGMLEAFGTPAGNLASVILILDKLEKNGLEAVNKELSDLGLPEPVIQSISGFLTAKDNGHLSYFEPFSSGSPLVQEGINELKELQSYLDYLGISGSCAFNPFLARGLDIYTGTVYEIFLTDQSVTSSIGSGGRYDNAVGGFLGTDDEISTVGISFGLDVIYTALASREKSAAAPSETDYYLIPVQAEKEALKVAGSLRKKGYSVELEMGGRKIGKALDRANKENISSVIIIGENEVRNGIYKIKDMATGEETTERFTY